MGRRHTVLFISRKQERQDRQIRHNSAQTPSYLLAFWAQSTVRVLSGQKKSRQLTNKSRNQCSRCTSLYVWKGLRKRRRKKGERKRSWMNRKGRMPVRMSSTRCCSDLFQVKRERFISAFSTDGILSLCVRGTQMRKKRLNHVTLCQTMLTIILTNLDRYLLCLICISLWQGGKKEKRFFFFKRNLAAQSRHTQMSSYDKIYEETTVNLQKTTRQMCT